MIRSSVQHQLIDASGASGYTASFGYTAGGRLDFATIDANPGTPEVQSRDVDYFYGGHSGPEAVDELRAAGGGTFASYRYDLRERLKPK